MKLEEELSGFAALSGAIEAALKAMEAQNYGTARELLRDALKAAEEYAVAVKDARSSL